MTDPSLQATPPGKKWVVTEYDAGIDGMEPVKYVGDDVGPFDTFWEAHYCMQDLYAHPAHPYQRWMTRVVTKQVTRWE